MHHDFKTFKANKVKTLTFVLLSINLCIINHLFSILMPNHFINLLRPIIVEHLAVEVMTVTFFVE